MTKRVTPDHRVCPAAVIEGVLDVTTVYVITLETRTRSRPATLCPSCQAAAAQVSIRRA